MIERVVVDCKENDDLPKEGDSKPRIEDSMRRSYT